MNTETSIPSSQRLAEANPNAMEHHRKMRAALTSNELISTDLSEIVLVAQFAVLGYERPFKIHARRAFDNGVSKDCLRAILMLGLGVTSVAFDVARSLCWLDEALSPASSL